MLPQAGFAAGVIDPVGVFGIELIVTVTDWRAALEPQLFSACI